jgi:hypothetical protein
MKKVSLLILIFTLVTLVLALTSCGAEANAAPTGEEAVPLFDTVMNAIKSGDIGTAVDIIMDAFTTSAGIVGAVFAVIVILILLAVYFLGLWIFI